MQPQGPSISPEQGPIAQPVGEQPSGIEDQPENINFGTQEVIAPQGDKVNQGPVLPSVSLPTPQPIIAPTNLVPTDISMGAQYIPNSPAIADDVDVIEKEWVDKAKSIVNQNKHDPYNQEKEIGKLQADYLKKRYGKIVKVNE